MKDLQTYKQIDTRTLHDKDYEYVYLAQNWDGRRCYVRRNWSMVWLTAPYEAVDATRLRELSWVACPVADVSTTRDSAVYAHFYYHQETFDG